MIRLNLCVEGIPAILWGKETGKMVVAVHGNMSNKADEPIVLLAEAAIPSGYQVLSLICRSTETENRNPPFARFRIAFMILPR